MRDGREIFEEWFSELSEDERSEFNRPFSDRAFRNYVSFYTTLDEDERDAVDDFFNDLYGQYN
jgi:hypothetical protein